jgi:hypothetical protein
MSKVDWDHLKLIEEWSDNSSKPDDAARIEEKRINVLSSLILKIYRQQKIEEWKKLQKENDRIRRKAGLT